MPIATLAPGALVVSALLLSVACASGGADAPPRADSPRHEFLLPPTEGWDGTLDPEQRSALAGGFRALTQDGDAAAASAAAAALLVQSPDLHPALLLAAQADLVGGAPERARGLLADWIAGQPKYRAARLLWARVLELGSEVALAHAEYRALADQIPIAAQRARATREPAIAAAQSEIERALAAGRVDDARTWADRLSQWEPSDSLPLLEIRRRIASAAGDEPGELEALRALHGRGQDERALLERLAELELEIGDADQALRLLEGLVDRHPEDASLRSQLAAAQLRFRLRLLPEGVRKLAARGELGRGELAALLYWMVPGVRQAQGSASARIATDVLDHDWQQEIIRVVNHGLMQVNPVVHRFEPDRPVTRVEALHSALVVAAERPGGECARDARTQPRSSPAFVCELALRCRLIDEADSCLPHARLSGGEALDLLGRSLSLHPTE